MEKKQVLMQISCMLFNVRPNSSDIMFCCSGVFSLAPEKLPFQIEMDMHEEFNFT